MNSTEEKIVSAAKELLTEASPAAVKISDICTKAGISQGTFFYHFKTKKDLLDRISLEHNRNNPNDWYDVMLNGDLLEQAVRACSMCALRAQRSNPMLTSQYYITQLSGGADKFEKEHAFERKAACELIGRAQNAGQIRNQTEPEKLAWQALCIASGTIVEWCKTGGDFNLEEAVKEALFSLFDAVR